VEHTEKNDIETSRDYEPAESGPVVPWVKRGEASKSTENQYPYAWTYKCEYSNPQQKGRFRQIDVQIPHHIEDSHTLK